MMLYELRVIGYTPGRPPKSTLLSSAEQAWRDWDGDADDAGNYDNVSYMGLKGLEGLAEATAREYVADGCKRVIIQRRTVSPWEEIAR